jgi:hypothetical protein
MILSVLISASGAYLYYRYGQYYAQGMCEYVRRNNIPGRGKEDRALPGHEQCIDSIINESRELKEAIYTCSPVNIFLEFFDVVQALTQSVIIERLPATVSCSWITWSLLFFFVLPVGIKLGSRYHRYRCIRNHANPANRRHICSYRSN